VFSIDALQPTRGAPSCLNLPKSPPVVRLFLMTIFDARWWWRGRARMLRLSVSLVWGYVHDPAAGRDTAGSYCLIDMHSVAGEQCHFPAKREGSICLRRYYETESKYICVVRAGSMARH
jgi:hypothetical protein